jgi:hypothetical protein
VSRHATLLGSIDMCQTAQPNTQLSEPRLPSSIGTDVGKGRQDLSALSVDPTFSFSAARITNTSSTPISGYLVIVATNWACWPSVRRSPP